MDSETHQVAADHRTQWWRPVVLLGVVIAILVFAHLFGLGGKLGNLRGWIKSYGTLAPVVFILLYATAATVGIPGSILTLAAGATFGSFLGVILVSIASTLGASFAFLIARYFARESISRGLSGNETFRRVDRMTAKRGAIIVALTRLIPLFPYDLLNYAFGLTGIPFKTYVFWSWLCMLPGTVLYVAGADAIFSGIAHRGLPWKLIAVIVVAVSALAILIRYARRRLDQEDERI